MRTSLALLLVVALAGAAVPVGAPADVGMDAVRLAAIDAAVNAAIKEGKAPGAVVLVLRSSKVVFRKAYGRRAVAPAAEPMTPDTVFDLASLTKPVATATSVALLARRGKLNVDDAARKHLPAFTGGGKESVTLAHLLLHTSGLPAGNPVADYEKGKRTAIDRICALPLKSAAGEKFVYSDLGYILLGAVVEKVSGTTLDAFARQHLFAPLGMTDTSFGPLTEAKDRPRLARTAPTEKVGGKFLRGVVHDPRARAMGGVTGHAGLFGTADDLAVFAQMLLDGGRLGDKRILDAPVVDALTRAHDVPGGKRTYGWDARTAYSSNRGELFGGFGHTGFTGTSMWIDPGSKTAVIVLTNRVHPDGKGNVLRLRGSVATAAARAIVKEPLPSGKR